MSANTAIILLNYNSYSDTSECVESILASEEKNYKIFVVDNASMDKSFIKLKKNYANNSLIKFFSSKDNLGFSAGCNIGVRYAIEKEFEYILLLNNDTLVTKKFLKELILIAENDKKTGIVGGKTLFADDKKSVWDAGGFINNITFRGVRRREGSIGINEVGEVGFVTCCLALIKKEVFNKIGLLSEAYFFGSEEWEFSLRARKVGFKLLYTPRSLIYHKVGRSHDNTSAKMIYNTYRNRILFVKRNYGTFKYICFTFVFFIFKFFQKLFNVGQLSKFSFKQANYILIKTLKDSFKYDTVSKKDLLTIEKNIKSAAN